MNINGKELLLLNNKKIKFGETQDQGNSVETTPQANFSKNKFGINALATQGLNNVVSNPALAKNIGITDENTTQTNQDATNYVAPYKSNIAFEGGKFKSIALASMMALMTLGSAPVLTSCETTKVEQSVEVDMSALLEVLAEIKALRQDMANKDKENAAKMDQLIAMFTQVITMMQENQMNDAAFQGMVLANQSIIIDLMMQQGITQEEANKKLDEILNSNMTIAEKMDAITNLLQGIKDLIQSAIDKFSQYYEQMLAKQDELIETNKAGFEELIETGNISNDKLDKMIEQNDSLLAYTEKASEERNAIKEAIVKANIDSNAKFDEVVKTLNVNKNDLIAMLVKMGYQQSQILKMSAGEIIKAIDKNTEVTEKGNMLLVNVTKQLQILPKLLKENKITNAQINEFYEEFLDAVALGSNYSEESIARLEALLGKLEQISGQLDYITALIEKAIEKFSYYHEKMIAKQDELLETNKAGFKELIETGNITNEKLDIITEQNDSLLAYNAKASEERQAIKDAIVKANIDSNANFETVVKTLNVNKNDLIATLKKMGCQQAQIVKMTAGQILSAIDKNTKETEKGNQLLCNISCKLQVLPKLLKENKVTNAEIKNIYNLLENIEIPNGNFSPEVIAQLQEIANKLDAIQESLDAILAKLSTIAEDFAEFKSDYNENKVKEFEMMNILIQENKIQTSILEQMKNTQNDMEANLNGIKQNTDLLLEIVQDDSKHKELITAIKDIDVNVNTGIDKETLKALFKQMGIELAEVLEMSQAELLAAIKKFEQTYIDTEAKELGQLKSINSKLDDIKCFNNVAKDEIVAAIKNITITNDGNNGDVIVNVDLSKIETKIDQVINLLTNELKGIASQISKANAYLASYDAKWNATLNLFEDFEDKFNTIISNQKIAQKTLDNLLEEVRNIKAEMKKFQASTGCEGISPEELEAMWQKHDEANFNKYKDLIEKLNIKSCDHVNIENLLQAIDDKLGAQKDYSDILNKILAKLDGIDLTNEQLGEIKELLKNFKFNCECGKTNEGVLGDLDNILG